jgi:hypothetical protein
MPCLGVLFRNGSSPWALDSRDMKLSQLVLNRKRPVTDLLAKDLGLRKVYVAGPDRINRGKLRRFK